MTTIDKVKDTASRLGFLDQDGNLKMLDSLSMVDLIVGLEDATGVAIPATKLREENFASLASIAGLIDQLSRG